MIDILITLAGFVAIQVVLVTVCGLWNIRQEINKLCNHISEIQADVGELKEILGNRNRRVVVSPSPVKLC
ncbi:hypothetical protein M1N22_01045 [Dehalococcoidia bacterium]|nr:hypothetical protein [Dehalococcoidia bacterium]MCL0064824.1 hypothetical protein [Dehalococcoidia bacterium]MCL0070396.1 hypothetical protein [Dehalococcoidia bacterium]